MGIRGLKSFIENNSDLLVRHDLHDTHLVIDGNNLMYSLYWSCSRVTRDYIYGGDYNRFATAVQHFFRSLNKCCIRALVVFDGGIDPSQQKMRTIIQRFRKNLEEAKRISKGNTCAERIIPTLCKPVLLEIMAELGVAHIQASFEADAWIARLANQLQCPVLSNDSDFFVFDLSFGVISIDSLINSLIVKTYCDPNDSTIGYKYLDCNLFLIENLIQYFPGLKREVLPLFSALMGNDWVESYVFDNIFNAIPNVLPNSKRKSKGLHVGKRHLRMIKLLNWLRDKTVEESVEFLITFLKKNSRNNALNLLQLSLESYSNDQSFEQTLDSIDLSELASLLPNKDQTLPKWFVEEFHKSLMSTTFMNTIKMKCNFLSPRVEDFSLSSSYSSGLELRQYLVALLRADDKDINTVTIFDRKATQMTTYPIEPQLLTPNRLQILPNFHQIRDISIAERRILFADILSIDDILIEKIHNLFIFNESKTETNNIDPNGGVFLILVLKYWIRKCVHQIWIEFIYSLVTSIMFCGQIGSYTKTRFISFDRNETKESIDNLSKFNCIPVHNWAKLYEPRVVHFFNEFQDCLKMIRSINLLFGSPFQMGKPFFCLNGPFIYNLTVELSSRRDPVLYLSQLFGRQSVATNILERLLSAVLDGSYANKLVRCLEVTNRRTHIHSQTIRSKRNRNEVKSKAKNLENRFAVLKID